MRATNAPGWRAIKASASPLIQANAERSIRWSCYRTAMTQKADMSAYGGLGTRCTSTRATRRRYVNRRCPLWRAQGQCGAYPSFAKVRATIQESNDARPLGDAPCRNTSRDWNGTLAAYCHVTPVERNQNEKQKDTVSGMGATKAVIGNCIPLTHSLFVSDIPRR
jgi:hypothetical protein